MAGLHDGFAGYRIADGAELDRALTTGIVVVDANVLLNLYRWAQTTSSDLLAVLERLGDRLWVPHQVVTEFWRGRLGAIATPAAAARQAKDQLTRAAATTNNAIRVWAKNASPTDEVGRTLLDRADAFFAQMAGEIDRVLPAQLPMTTPNREDPILTRLAAILDGRVGERPDDETWHAQVKEGTQRASAGVPPGYRDAKKSETDLPEGPAGDYLVWAQTLQEAMRRGSDLLLVTGDEKEDWWWKHRDEFLGPRRELVDEFHLRTGRELHFLRPSQLLARSVVLQVDVSVDSIEDAGRSWGVHDIPDVWKDADEEDGGALGEANDPWTARGVHQLLRRLDDESALQGEVIRAAAANGGRIQRERIYELCEYPDDRTLRGFAKPVARVTRALQRAGVVSPHVEPMLVPVYETGVLALAYDIPPEVVHILDGGA